MSSVKHLLFSPFQPTFNHLIPLQLKTKPKCYKNFNHTHLERQEGELILSIPVITVSIGKDCFEQVDKKQLHYCPSQVTNPPWMQQNVKDTLGNTRLLLYLDTVYSEVLSGWLVADLADLHLAWWSLELGVGCRALFVYASVSTARGAVSRGVSFPGLTQTDSVYRQ